MSDEERDDRHEYDGPDEGESEHEWIQRQSSSELQMLYLLRRLTARVETNEARMASNEEEFRRRDERIQSQIEFILHQQAEFQAKSDSDMQSLRDLQRQNEERWTRTSEEIRALLAIAEIHEREMYELRQTQAQAQARTDARLAETGGRVDALVNTVEQLIGERRNGGGKGGILDE